MARVHDDWKNMVRMAGNKVRRGPYRTRIMFGAQWSRGCQPSARLSTSPDFMHGLQSIAGELKFYAVWSLGLTVDMGLGSRSRVSGLHGLGFIGCIGCTGLGCTGFSVYRTHRV